MLILKANLDTDSTTEDLISQQIRDEAINTWSLGKPLGIRGIDDAMISVLLEMDDPGKGEKKKCDK